MSPILSDNHDVTSRMLSSYTSLTHTKGLLNGPGQNNCFLNSAVQVLWHLDIFRRSFRELSGHACMMDSCIFCALKELFTQFQYSHESALPPDALRRALAETFVNQQRFQLGFMDDAAECFENILMRIHFHIANGQSEDMCNAQHCIPHQKFAMTLVEQGVCHACGATSEPLPFTQMVHYISSSALCAQSKINREETGAGICSEQFGQLLRKAGGLGEVRHCPSVCGAKIQIQRTLMNRPEIVSIGIVWDSERPNLDHIMDVFQTIGTTIQLQDVFHSCVDDHWASSATHQLVGVVTYYGKHYSTFFFHTKLRVWIYFDDATVREIGPHWEQVVDKCHRGHFQPLLLLYANPYGNPVATESAQKMVTYVPGHQCGNHQANEYRLIDNINGRIAQQRRAVTPNPELRRELCTDVKPRRAITPNAELHRFESHNNRMATRKTTYSPYVWQHLDSDGGYSSSDRQSSFPIGQNLPSSYGFYNPDSQSLYQGMTQPKALNQVFGSDLVNPYSKDLIQKLTIDGFPYSSEEASYDQRGPLHANVYFNNCDIPDGHPKNASLNSNAFVYQQQQNELNNPDMTCNNSDHIYISRKTVENVLNYQKLQLHRHTSCNYNGFNAGNRNSNSSLESFENALRIRGQTNFTFPFEGKVQESQDLCAQTVGNLARSRDSGNWSGDRNSASSTSSASVENPYYILKSSNRQIPGQQDYRCSTNKALTEGCLRTPYDTGYDSFSLSSNDSFPVGQHGHTKHNQQLAQIPEYVMDSAVKVSQNSGSGEFVDECHTLCLEADKFLEKSMEHENTGDLDGAISLCNGAAAKAREAMDAPYSNPQILAFARMKHNSCIMRVRSLHRRMLVRQDSINSHGSSSTSTETDSPRRPDGDSASGIHHSRQSSRDSTRSRRVGIGNHSRQSSRDGGRHNCQGSRDNTHSWQNSQDAAEKKHIELYGTLPKNSNKKRLEKSRTGSIRIKDEHVMHGQHTNASVEVNQSSAILTENDSCGRLRIKEMKTSDSELKKMFQGSDLVVSRDRNPLSTDYSDYVNEWGNTRKSSLYRNNSVPPNFPHECNNSQSCTDLLTATKGKDDCSKNNTTNKLGKKQHKIRRKLLMGGLIRRKNRSMPDLREEQDPSPLSDVSQRAFDDSALRKSEQSLETLTDREMNHRNPNTPQCLSHQKLYNESAHQRLYSSHGKIPPPPPVRTTSQLSTRSQSHGNLIYTQQPPTSFLNNFVQNAHCAPISVPSPAAFAQTSTMSSVPDGRGRSTAVPNIPSQLTQGQYLAQHKQTSALQPEQTLPVNKMTIQADVHHERTPSDNIRPVYLVRRPSINSNTANHSVQQRSYPTLSSQAELKASSIPLASSYSYPSSSGSQVAQYQNISSVTQQNAEAKNREEEEPSPSGLLAELQMKCQQILENPAAKSVHVFKRPEVKANGSSGNSWLRELQAKQQQMCNKKLDSSAIPSETEVPASKDVSSGLLMLHSQEDLKKQPTTKHLATISAPRRVQGIETVATTTSIICSARPKAGAVGAIDYKPKSVRALANQFEQILLNPSAQLQNASVIPLGSVVQDKSKILACSSPNHMNGVSQDAKSFSPALDDISNELPNYCHQQMIVHGNSDSLNSSCRGNCGAFVNSAAIEISDLKTAVYSSKRGFENRQITDQKGNPFSRVGQKDPTEDPSSPHLVDSNLSAYPTNNSTHTNSSPVPLGGIFMPERHCSSEVNAYDPGCPSVNHSGTDVHHTGFNSIRSENFSTSENGSSNINAPTSPHNLWPYTYYNTSSTNGYFENETISSGSIRSTEVWSEEEFHQESQKHMLTSLLQGSSETACNMDIANSTVRCAATPYTDRVLPNYNPPSPAGTMVLTGVRTNGVNVDPQKTTLTETSGLLQWQSSIHTMDFDNLSQANNTRISEKDLLKKKKGKKSVTFSDQIALVASAEDNDVMPIRNPLLEKVLLKSAVASSMTNKSGITSLYPNTSRMNDNSNDHSREVVKCPVDSPLSLIHPSQSLPALPLLSSTTFNHLNTKQQQPHLNNSVTSKPKLSCSTVPCYLCGKKTVLPPVVYCLDCDFYMSRFRPK